MILLIVKIKHTNNKPKDLNDEKVQATLNR